MNQATFIRKSGIYVIENRVSGKCYVGSALYLRGRRAHHIKRLDLGKHKNNHLQRAWNKYGKECFSFSVLLYCDRDNLLFYEQRIIDSFVRKIGRGLLYNLELIAGSALGRKHSDETKMKIGLGRKGKKHSEETLAFYRATRRGVFPSDEARRKMSEFQRSRVRSKESGRKISLALRGGKRSQATIEKMSAAMMGKGLGKVNSPETRLKISMALTGKPLSDEHKMKISSAHKGKVFSGELRERLSIIGKATWAKRKLKMKEAA